MMVWITQFSALCTTLELDELAQHSQFTESLYIVDFVVKQQQITLQAYSIERISKPSRANRQL